ncbi:MAG: AMP-binding protein [Prosthecochloris sp.]|nr:AMP-binding protein [Prosthecochloris sp.]
MNIADILEQQADKYGEKPCVYMDEDVWTFRELNDHVWQTACHLFDNGIRTGDILALKFTRQITQFVTMMAAARIGATVFSLPISTPHEKGALLLKSLQPKLVATDTAVQGNAAIRNVRIPLDNLKTQSIPENRDIKNDNPHTPWIIMSGSGSTGKTKLMPVTHQQQWQRATYGTRWVPYSDKDLFVSLIHLDYYTAKQRYIEALAKGAAIGLFERTAQTFRNSHRNNTPSAVYGTVFHAEQLLNTVSNGNEALSVLMLNCSTVTSSLRQRIRERLTSNLFVLYGTNESGTACSTAPENVYDIQGTVGRPHKGFEVQIVDDADKPLPDGQAGHIRIRSKASIDGYVDDQEATEKAFRNGWFYPGDIGKMTDDGQLIHLGRSDDMMILNGINIYPAEIEQTITAHPAVREAVALPLHHNIHQDIPVCAVVPEPQSAISERELVDYVRQHLGTHALHRAFILDRIPRNEQGKPVRPELNRLIAARLQNNAGEGRSGRQLKKMLRCSCTIPEHIDTAMIDRWIADALESDPDQARFITAAQGVQLPDEALGWLQRCLHMTIVILQSAGVPVFAPPAIHSVSFKKSSHRQCEATIALPFIDGFPAAMYKAGLDTAFRLGEWACCHEPETENRRFFYETIQKDVITPLSKTLPVGKSTLPVLREAFRSAIPFSHLGGGIFQLGWGARARRMDRSTTELDSAMGLKLSHSKVLSTRLLHSAGLPAPLHKVVRTAELALDTARRFGWPVVVKPADRDRGEGITIDVDREEELSTALQHAQNTSATRQVIVEQQVPGICHRLFVADGRLLYAVKRLPMSVRGDGILTVSELVRKEYEHQQRRPPWKRTEIQALDELAIDAMAKEGLFPDSIPAEGRLVPLRRIESTEWGGIDEELTRVVHPENSRIAIEAARLFGLHVAGIDIITTDISRPWHENRAIINEVNYAPLFGGGEISRRHIPIFMKEFMQGNGHIPVEVFVGGNNALEASSQRWQQLLANGIKAYLTNSVKTFTPSASQRPLTFNSLYRRVRALALSADVEAIVMVVQNDEFLDSGLPLEYASSIRNFNEPLYSFSSPGQLLSTDRLNTLLQLLKGWQYHPPMAKTGDERSLHG